MSSISFVILHYIDLDTTLQCVESILTSINYNYNIIIVDNGSPNDSVKKLEEIYKDNDKICILCADKNLGFAQGNNIGYKYAKEKLAADYIIVTNNDTIFRQADFAELMIGEYKRTKAHIMGPDLIVPNGSHQNPHRNHILSKKEVRKMLMVKTCFLYYFKIKKMLHLGSKVQLLEKLYKEKDLKTQMLKTQEYQKERTDIVLQGACLIFTPEYIRCESEAFFPGTFMYGEEDLLAYKCKKKGYHIVYVPKLQVLHMQGQATEKTYKVLLDKNIFMYEHIVKGCRLLLREMKAE